MGKRLYVGNLDYAVTESALHELFETMGEIESVSLITDRMTGRSKGFAFVEMVDDAAAQQAIDELNGRMMGQRPIRVDEARPRPERSSGWGGGGGGGRRDRW
jgi:RNA recognition motif-containing protein